MRMNERILNDARVAIHRGAGAYPTTPPFSPHDTYPEYPFGPEETPNSPNVAYDGVRNVLRLAGLDPDRVGKPSWNPLGEIIRPGDVVVLKPNWVREFRDTKSDHDDCVMTHPSIIRVVLDYAYIALRGRGRLIVADAPHNDACFAAIRKVMCLDAIESFYRKHSQIEVEVFDLRPQEARKINGIIVGHNDLPGDPRGYTIANLGEYSMFAEIEDLCHLLYGSEYDMRELHRHQGSGVHEYSISRTVLEADVVISLPKLKTHKKVGVTINLKNLVGINGNKNWLPHHREGTPSQGGDQFPSDHFKNRLERVSVAAFKKTFPYFGPLRAYVAGTIKAIGNRVFGDTVRDKIRSGNWYGNDTTWRMALDLNRILLYCDPEGHLSPTPVRRFFSVVDGIVGGQGNGPLDPFPAHAGLIIAGGNPLAVDLVCAHAMGFDCTKIPILFRGLEPHEFPLCRFSRADVEICSNDQSLAGHTASVPWNLQQFEPHFGWKGHIELKASQRSG